MTPPTPIVSWICEILRPHGSALKLAPFGTPCRRTTVWPAAYSCPRATRRCTHSRHPPPAYCPAFPLPNRPVDSGRCAHSVSPNAISTARGKKMRVGSAFPFIEAEKRLERFELIRIRLTRFRKEFVVSPVRGVFCGSFPFRSPQTPLTGLTTNEARLHAQSQSLLTLLARNPSTKKLFKRKRGYVIS